MWIHRHRDRRVLGRVVAAGVVGVAAIAGGDRPRSRAGKHQLAGTVSGRGDDRATASFSRTRRQGH